MKKFTTFLSILCLAIISICSSCSDDPEADSEAEAKKNVPDPVGTVQLAMRDADNGKTTLEYSNSYSIYIDNENFEGASFVDIGSVNGLGNITQIPREGWASKVAVIPGHGYIACLATQYNSYLNQNYVFYRIYVIDYIYSTSGGIIGADIKYQSPFYGEDIELIPNKTAITLNWSQFSGSNHGIGGRISMYYSPKNDTEINNDLTVNFLNDKIIPFKYETIIYDTYKEEYYNSPEASTSNFLMSATIQYAGHPTYYGKYGDYYAYPFSYEGWISLISSKTTEIGYLKCTTFYGKEVQIKIMVDPSK